MLKAQGTQVSEERLASLRRWNRTSSINTMLSWEFPAEPALLRSKPPTGEAHVGGPLYVSCCHARLAKHWCVVC